MSKSQICTHNNVVLPVVMAGVLLLLVSPFVASAQMPEQARAAQERATADERGPAQRGGASDVESMRAQVQELEGRLRALQRQAERDHSRAASEQASRGNAPETRGQMPTLPEQASDRAQQVMQCLQLGRTMGLGVRGPDVEQLQMFLMERGHFNFDRATGFFGQITQEAVEAFQDTEGIVSEGSPETTGFGLVGPRTRAALAQASCLRGDGAEADVAEEDANGATEEPATEDEDMNEEEEEEEEEEETDDEESDEDEDENDEEEEEEEDEENDV